ncbi:MAG: hypothetical protein KF814_04260 [Nitrospiraceae bacterium]|nr:hypothetical protein [Nitrospiraceae bacterium]
MSLQSEVSLQPSGNRFLGSTLGGDSLGRDSPHITFLTGYLSQGGGGRWLLRAVVVSCAGVLVASFIVASRVDYHDSRNSGLVGAPFGAIALFWRSHRRG